MKIVKFDGARAMCPAILLFSIAAFALNAAAQTTPADAKAKIISSQEYRMPEASVAAGIDGTVSIGITVDKTGKMRGAKIFGGPAWPCGTTPKKEIEEVLKSVAANISTFQFSPAIENGKPADSSIIHSFELGRTYRDLIKLSEAEEAAKTGAPVPKVVDAGFLNGKALSLPEPSNPARAQGVTGTIPVHIVFNEEGRVILAGALSGHPLLQAAAREAACRAKFAPVSLKEQPINVKGLVTYKFSPR
jgi:TonB family protein